MNDDVVDQMRLRMRALAADVEDLRAEGIVLRSQLREMEQRLCDAKGWHEAAEAQKRRAEEAWATADVAARDAIRAEDRMGQLEDALQAAEAEARHWQGIAEARARRSAELHREIEEVRASEDNAWNTVHSLQFQMEDAKKKRAKEGKDAE